MKIVNCILVSIILILTITSIVFANQLDRKRFMIKVRADEMKRETLKIAENYDDLLFIELGKKIPKHDLHHFRTKGQLATKVYEIMDKQFKSFADYRDACVSEINKMATTLEIPEHFDLAGHNTSEAINEAQKKIVEATQKLNARDKANIADCTELAQTLGVPDVTEESFSNRESPTMAMDTFESMRRKVDEMWKRIQLFETGLARAGTTLEVSERPDFANDFEPTLNQIKERATEIQPRIAKLKVDIQTAKDRQVELEGIVKGLEGDIKLRKEDLQYRINAIARACSTIGIPVPEQLPSQMTVPATTSGWDYPEDPALIPAPTEKIALNAPSIAPPPPFTERPETQWKITDRRILLNELKANVIGVSNKDGFVIVNGGLQMKLKQPGKDNVVETGIPNKKVDMIIMRPGSTKPIFRGRVTVARVESDKTFLNINKFPGVRTDIREGDYAIFTHETVDKIINAPKETVEITVKQDITGDGVIIEEANKNE